MNFKDPYRESAAFIGLTNRCYTRRKESRHRLGGSHPEGLEERYGTCVKAVANEITNIGLSFCLYAPVYRNSTNGYVYKYSAPCINPSRVI